MADGQVTNDFLIDIVDDQWRQDKLPHEDIAVPIDELPPVGEDSYLLNPETGARITSSGMVGTMSGVTCGKNSGKNKRANAKPTVKELENRWTDQGLYRFFNQPMSSANK
ncbi:uncharacterized protein LOC142353132 [Convolutriloba macropyga]|uniref:uncharacterized protein LOC142353132 n=1 Tax=Convolutriloba macropyga TaxID=536237 RepID=UPI003F52060B